MGNCLNEDVMFRNESGMPPVPAVDKPLLIKYYTYLCQGLFDGKWHQLKLLVRPPQLSSFLDDRLVRKLSLDPVDPIYINGKTQLSKRPGSDVTVPVSMKSSAPFYHRWLLKKKNTKKTKEIFHFLFSRWTFRNCVCIVILCRVRERRPVRSPQ